MKTTDSTLQSAAVAAPQAETGPAERELEITGSRPRQGRRTDAEIASLVSACLRNQLLLSELSVTAQVERGWVTLDGEVEIPAQKFAAEQAVSQIADVRGVINLIAVTSPQAWGWKQYGRLTAAA